MQIGYVFPGQGAQAVGMFADLRAKFAHLDERLAEASAIVGEDLVSLIVDGPAETLNQTEITQPVMLTTSVALFEIWRESGGVQPHAVAGHSLGEYSALTAVGTFDFSDAVKLVHERGKLMQGAVPQGEGAMAAILGLELDELQALCDVVDEVVAPANINSPGQVVIAGSSEGVQAVSDQVVAAGDKRKRVVPLDVSVPSHCELMKPAATGVAELLQQAEMKQPACPIYQNFSAESTTDVAVIKANLIEQLSSPVRWADCMSAMAAGGCTTFIECGPGKVLSGLARRIDRSMACKPIGSVEDFTSTKEALAA